ncbi:filamentous hemagglutinin N-terminal domain-containing protein [cf. Phormidesmis sp. LEGE 11477]|nr:filamentous hemagglutinin N-terminal domain-containing protein [cf. Phormidesmis sp. LEGE 11477]
MITAFPFVYRTPAIAQVSADTSLSTRVEVSNGSTFTITDGQQAGENLFHSFSEFSVPTGAEAIFAPDASVGRIISRVTGGNLSTIDGTVEVRGNADLFLLNPSGILFNDNAQLKLEGSFVGSTASSISFTDGFVLPTAQTSAAPLLTVSAPIGLQMTPASDEITARNSGHHLSFSDPITDQLITRMPNNGLSAGAGRTMAFLGNRINFEGGIATADSGNIELASVTEGNVHISFDSNQIALDTSTVERFSHISMTQQALVNTSGTGNNGVHLWGDLIELSDSSIVLVQNQGSQSGSELSVTATEAVKLAGITSDGSLGSGFFSEASSTGNGPQINVSAPQMSMQGGDIRSVTTGSATGGELSLQIADRVEADRFWLSDSVSKGSIISAQTSGTGQAGNIDLETERFILSNGGLLSSYANGAGDGGAVNLTNLRSLELMAQRQVPRPSVISSASLGNGNGGRLYIQAEQVTLLGSGVISSSTYGAGNAGDVVIDATEFVEINGDQPGADITSQISSTSERFGQEFVRRALRLPTVPSGDAGSVEINTAQLSVINNADLSVSNDGTGNAGNITASAAEITIAQAGNITATTRSGEGGELDLTGRDVILLRNLGLISSEAGGTGNGGNIILRSPVVLGVENSDIVANAFQGDGGRITIESIAILGLRLRDALTPGNDITVSSQFGTSGTVETSVLVSNPSDGTVSLSDDVVEVDQQVAAGCSQQQANQFITSGRGGIPVSPHSYLASNRPWQDLRILQDLSSHQVDTRTSVYNQHTGSEPINVQEATGWQQTEAGEIELMDTASSPLSSMSTTSCLANYDT